jgi:adenosylcobinamide kinase/adenosylcobinamide-phosphate guanylyltransferase
MHLRVQKHQNERGTHWHTVEEPLDIDQAIRQHGPAADVCLVDCLTLWVTNLILAHESDELVGRCITRLCERISDPPCDLILVTNEVGTGIVPENQLARRFRDMTGWTNQQVAAACRTVIWMVAGIAVTIKPQNETNGLGKK